MEAISLRGASQHRLRKARRTEMVWADQPGATSHSYCLSLHVCGRVRGWRSRLSEPRHFFSFLQGCPEDRDKPRLDLYTVPLLDEARKLLGRSIAHFGHGFAKS